MQRHFFGGAWDPLRLFAHNFVDHDFTSLLIHGEVQHGEVLPVQRIWHMLDNCCYLSNILPYVGRAPVGTNGCFGAQRGFLVCDAAVVGQAKEVFARFVV